MGGYGASLSVGAWDASERMEILDGFRLKGPKFNVGPASRTAPWAGIADMPMCYMLACMKALAIMAANGPPYPDDVATAGDGAGTSGNVALTTEV